jgi:hypothetical protein
MTDEFDGHEPAGIPAPAALERVPAPALSAIPRIRPGHSGAEQCTPEPLTLVRILRGTAKGSKFERNF